VLTTTIIVPTYNRPKELGDFIHSLLAQTVTPGELIIVDDGSLEAVPWKDQLDAKGIRSIYVQKSKPGLTESRNKGISLATGDIIFFFDDDVILYPDYLEQVLKVYVSPAHSNAGGVGGMMINSPDPSLFAGLRKILELVFMNCGLREGRILRSGFFTDLKEDIGPRDETLGVDYLPGCAMSFKKLVFSQYQFTEGYRDYGFGEDKDFSYQVSRNYPLFIQKQACLHHLESENQRPDRVKYGKKYVLGRYIFFKTRVQQKAWEQLCFNWALAGYILIRVVTLTSSPCRKNMDHIKGIFQALEDILQDRISLVRKTTKPKG